MSVQSDVTEQVLRLSLNGIQTGIRLAGKGVKRTALWLNAAFLASKKTRGMTKVTELLKSGQELKVFTIPTKYLTQFCLDAKQYGLQYSVVKEAKKKDGLTDILVKDFDVAKVNRIMERLEPQSKMVREFKEEIHKEVAGAKNDKDTMAEKQQKAFEKMSDIDQVKSLMGATKRVAQNPEEARAEHHPRLFVPSSETCKSSEEISGGQKPSVKKELKRLEKDLYERAKQYNQARLNGLTRNERGKERDR